MATTSRSRTRPSRISGWLLASLALACDPSPAANDEVLRLIDDVITIGNDNVAVVCDCWDEAGFASRGECLEDQILPSQRRCVEDAYLRAPEASELFLSCVTPILRELGDCLDARLSCEDPGDADACFADYELGRESCVEVPRSVGRALDDCSVAGAGDSGPDPADDSPGESGGPPGDSPTDPPAPTDPGGCPFEDDGECDEPEGTGLCPEESDSVDCQGPSPAPP